jgi:hypothetical protein
MPARSSAAMKGDFRELRDRVGESPFMDSVDTNLLTGQINDQRSMKEDATVSRFRRNCMLITRQEK